MTALLEQSAATTTHDNINYIDILLVITNNVRFVCITIKGLSEQGCRGVERKLRHTAIIEEQTYDI